MNGTVFKVALLKLQPSQLYICAGKLAAVNEAWDEIAMFPLPVKWMDGRWMLTDGHTRALEAWRRGLTTVRVVPDTDDLDWEAYAICLGWCREEGIKCVADLAGRVISGSEFDILWIDRCERMQAGLEEKRARLAGEE